MSRGGVALLAGGVFVSVFAASWWGLPLLRADRAASTTGLGVHAAWAPANLKLQKGKALDPKSRAARDRETEDAGLQIIAMAKGVKFPPDLVASARDDGPTCGSPRSRPGTGAASPAPRGWITVGWST